KMDEQSRPFGSFYLIDELIQAIQSRLRNCKCLVLAVQALEQAQMSQRDQGRHLNYDALGLASNLNSSLHLVQTATEATNAKFRVSRKVGPCFDFISSRELGIRVKWKWLRAIEVTQNRDLLAPILKTLDYWRQVELITNSNTNELNG